MKIIEGRLGDNENGKSSYNKAPTADKLLSASETNADNDGTLPPERPFERVSEEGKCRLDELKLYDDEKGRSWPIQVCTFYPFEKFEIKN